MQLVHQGKISLERDSAATDLVSTKCGCFDSKWLHAIRRIQSTRMAYSKKNGFTDEDLLLGSRLHSRPLFEQKVNRILVDGESTLNILPLRILKELGIPINELSNTRLIIQGINQGGQRAVNIIRMELLNDDMVLTILFHVIDAKTSYNILLVRKVIGDIKTFTEAESHFANIKYHMEDAKKGKEVLPSEEPKPYDNQSVRKNNSSTIEVALSKNLTLPLTHIDKKQLSKLSIKGFCALNPRKRRI
ncbi:hypothetical protein Sango_2106100 [Sesamum angolense]|uniref:Uncharacterized protein n=1 Tax=Sesamum angolense TaxID=2727404 RepID=A0AAE1WBU5_9LAMI|nr:hypothetical protein Sango_2106100 [Sesamum angolense]